MAQRRANQAEARERNAAAASGGRATGAKGGEAQARRDLSKPTNSRVTHLWQFPLLLFSLGLFGYAAYLFIDPKPGLSIDQKIDVARSLLKKERPEAAIEQLNKLLNTEKLERDREGEIHLLLAEGLEMGQKQLRINVPANHLRIIEQTQLALAGGVRPVAEIYRRLGDSYDALEHSPEAVANYRQAMAMDPSRGERLQKRVIELQLAQGEAGAAEASLNQYLRDKELSDSERAWATGEKAHLLIDQGSYAEARSLLNEALRLEGDAVAQGVMNYHLGYCAWKLGDADQAERLLRLAREQLRVQHPADAEAAYTLGRIYQEKNDPATANSFYEVVLTSHPGSKVVPMARLGRGLCRIMQGQDDPGLTDLHDVVGAVAAKAALARNKGDVVAGVRQAATLLSSKGNFQGALEALGYEQELVPQPQPTFFARMGSVYENRAEQVERSIPDAPPAEKVRRGQQVREMRAKAGDAYVAYSRALTLADDKGYGEALWRGIDLYDRAADLQRVIAALELFVAERPEDPLAPDAVLRLGRAYQAGGMFDKAIGAYQRNQLNYPRSLAASKSAVPLALAYIAKGPESYAKAEQVLLSVIENNPLLTPEAEEFKQGLFELGQLYYRTGRYEEAVMRLEEWTQRYPHEERMGQIVFLMADSYRKSAGLLDVKADLRPATQPAQQSGPATLPAEVVASASASSDPAVAVGVGRQAGAAASQAAEAAAAKKERLGKAKALYERAIELYRGSPPGTEVDRLYQKLSHFYRADCLYDLGGYEEAIRLYDAAALRYQEDPSSLAAYVQIVNAYCALGKYGEARTANERAKWLLRRMPAESFNGGGFTMPKEYWEQWLRWTADSGVWDGK